MTIFDDKRIAIRKEMELIAFINTEGALNVDFFELQALAAHKDYAHVVFAKASFVANHLDF